jgi:hypothetical protein
MLIGIYEFRARFVPRYSLGEKGKKIFMMRNQLVCVDFESSNSSKLSD